MVSTWDTGVVSLRGMCASTYRIGMTAANPTRTEAALTISARPGILRVIDTDTEGYHRATRPRLFPYSTTLVRSSGARELRP